MSLSSPFKNINSGFSHRMISYLVLSISTQLMRLIGMTPGLRLRLRRKADGTF